MLSAQFGSLVKARRARKGLTQAELARVARVSRTVLSRLECGNANAVQTDVLDRLLKALDFDPRIVDGPDPGEARKQARRDQQARLELQRDRHLRLAIHLAAGGKAARPMIERALARVELWRRKRTCSPLYIKRWSKILALPPGKMASAMASLGEWEDALFQNSPWSWAWN